MRINNIYVQKCIPRKKIIFELNDKKTAENYCARLLGAVREEWLALDLYAKDAYLILDGPIADSNGIIKEQENILNKVAEKIKYTITNDVPNFKEKIEIIIHTYGNIEELESGIASEINQALKANTKKRFMANNDLWLYAKIIKKAKEDGPYNNYDELDAHINEIFDNTNLINSYIKEINNAYYGGSDY